MTNENQGAKSSKMGSGSRSSLTRYGWARTRAWKKLGKKWQQKTLRQNARRAIRQIISQD